MFLSAALLITTAVALLMWLAPRKDFTEPRFAFPLIVGITNVPFLIYAEFDRAIFPNDLQSSVAIDDVNSLWFALLMIVFMALHNLGATLTTRMRVPSTHLRPPSGTVFMVLFIGASIASYVLFQRIGGLEFWIENVTRRTFTVERTPLERYFVETAFWLTTTLLLALAVRTGKLSSWALFLGCFAIAAISLSIVGSRKGVLWMSVLCAIQYLWIAKRVPRFTAIAAAAALSGYILIIGALRATGIGYYQPIDFASAFGAPIVDLVSTISYTPTYLFIVEHFSNGAYWFGEQFLVLPMNFSGHDVVIDDGVAIRALAAGHNITPTNIPNTVFLTSWPPETFGSAFANFGPLGVAVFGIALGVAHGLAFRFARHGLAAPWGATLYGFILLNFQFTNLRVVQTIGFLIILFTALSLNNLLSRNPSAQRP